MSNGLARLRTLPGFIPPKSAHNFLWINELSEDLGAPFPFKSGQHITVHEDVAIFTANIWAFGFKANEEHMQSLDVPIIQGQIPCGKRIGPLVDVT
eukprot:12413064-Karenia_brevis.AAC.1